MIATVFHELVILSMLSGGFSKALRASRAQRKHLGRKPHFLCKCSALALKSKDRTFLFE